LDGYLSDLNGMFLQSESTRMKKQLIRLLVLTAAISCSAQDLLENGDFNKGERRWEGRWKCEADGDNAFAAIPTHSSEPRILSQRFEVRNGVLDLNLKLKYKTSPDYKGRGFRILFERPDSNYTYRDVAVKPSESWQTFEWKFSDIKNAKSLNFKIEVRPGTGSLYFDDITIIAE
jgi:hypothetical protein